MSNLLVDANGILSRSYFVHKKSLEETGEGHYFIFVNIMSQIINEINFDNLHFMFDSKTCFRREQFVNYKSERESDPLRQEFVNLNRDCLERAGFSTHEVENYEADDLLASGCQDGDYVLSGDTDLLQLADKATVILLAGSFQNRKYYNRLEVYRKYGVWPEQWCDYKAVVGDKADGLPGVRGIGKVGAQNLLDEYETLENVYANLDNLSGKQVKLLLAGKDYAFITKKLSQLVYDVPLNLPKYPENDIRKVVPELQKALGIV